MKKIFKSSKNIIQQQYYKLFKQNNLLNNRLNNLYICFKTQLVILFLGPTSHMFSLLETSIISMIKIIDKHLVHPIPKLKPGKRTLLLLNHVGEIDNIMLLYFLYFTLGLNMQNYVTISSPEDYMGLMEKKYNICLATPKGLKFKKKYNHDGSDLIALFPEKFYFMPNPSFPHTNTPLFGALKDTVELFKPDKIIDSTLVFTQKGFRRTWDALDTFNNNTKIWTTVKEYNVDSIDNLELFLRTSFDQKNKYIENVLSNLS